MSGVFVMRIYKCNKNQENRRDSELIGKLGSTYNAYLSTSILEKALEITGQGFYMYVLSGDSYKGGDLPDYFYQFGTAIILKRNQGAIHVAIFGVDVPLIINFYNGSRWFGWDTYVRTSDLGYVNCEVNTIANDSIAIPGAPNDARRIPIIIGHSSINNCLENISYINGWRIYSTVAQTTYIRFFKYPV